MSSLLGSAACCTSESASEPGAGSSSWSHPSSAFHGDTSPPVLWSLPSIDRSCPSLPLLSTPSVSPSMPALTFQFHGGTVGQMPLQKNSTSHLHRANCPPLCFPALTCQPWVLLHLPFKGCLQTLLLRDSEFGHYDCFGQCLARGRLRWFQRGTGVGDWGPLSFQLHPGGRIDFIFSVGFYTDSPSFIKLISCCFCCGRPLFTSLLFISTTFSRTPSFA